MNIICFKGQKYLAEDNALPRLIIERQQKKALNIAIFDRGVQRKQNFADFHKQGIYFISRLSAQKVKIIKRLPLTVTETPGLIILADQIIRFASKVVMYLTMIAAILLTLYKQLNQIMGWAVAKIRFLDELYVEITGNWRSELALAFHPINIDSG